jgi:hypothetical protein
VSETAFFHGRHAAKTSVELAPLGLAWNNASGWVRWTILLSAHKVIAWKLFLLENFSRWCGKVCEGFPLCSLLVCHIVNTSSIRPRRDDLWKLIETCRDSVNRIIVDLWRRFRAWKRKNQSMSSSALYAENLRLARMMLQSIILHTGWCEGCGSLSSPYRSTTEPTIALHTRKAYANEVRLTQASTGCPSTWLQKGFSSRAGNNQSVSFPGLRWKFN